MHRLVIYMLPMVKAINVYELDILKMHKAVRLPES